MRFLNLLLLPLAATLSFSAISQSKYANDYRVLLQSGPIIPEANFEELLRSPNPWASAEANANGFAFKYLQFEEIPNSGTRASIEALGLQFLQYFPRKTYLVAIPIDFDASQLEGYRVRSIFDLPLEAKKNKQLDSPPYPDYAFDGQKLDVLVSFPEVLSAAHVRAQVTQHLADVEFDNTYNYSGQLRLQIAPDQVDPLVGMDVILYAELMAEPGEPENTLGRSMHRANVIDSEYATGRHYDGTGVSAAVNDDGFVGPHIDFTGRIDQSSITLDLGTHGDMTTGIVGGAGNLDPTMKGMATGSFLHVRQYSNIMPNTVDLHTNQQVMVFSTSYSNGCNTGYTAVTRRMDEEIVDNPSIIQVFSAGNSGALDCGYGAGAGWGNVTGGHKSAKNVIATANLLNNDQLVASSSRGPATDGRLKPEIAAHGNGQFSTDPNNTYAEGGGTSAAAPGIAGVLVQLYQAYRELNNGNDPNSALMKACLLNSAEDLGNPGPDFSFGYGRVNALRALTTLEDGRYLNASVDQGTTNTHNITIPAGVIEAKIMLQWMDPEAATNASQALINDLDLTVEDQFSAVTLPLVLDNTPSVASITANATPGVDNLNNTEQVVLQNPAAGNYTIQVNGAAIPQGPQSYYIVYEFRTNDITLTYPIGGEAFVPNVPERIRWDATDNGQTFTLEYSTDLGNTWNLITSNLNSTIREINWNVPNTVTGEALVRITRGTDVSESEAVFSIVGQPQNLNVAWTCPDSIMLDWSPVNGATSYEVSLLGAQYMDAVTTVTADSAVLYGLIPTEVDWLSVKALGPNGLVGRRAIAIPKPTLINNCRLPQDVQLQQVLNPASGTVNGCFDYGNISVMVKLYNSGSAPMSNVPINYSINGSAVTTETFAGPLNPGEEADYTFTTSVNLSAAGGYNINVWTTLGSDSNPYNDTISYGMQKTDETVTISVPYSEDFESYNLCAPQSTCEAIICSFPQTSGWVNEQNLVIDDIDWRVDLGGTDSEETGPDMDHNPGTFQGKYVYTEASFCFGREAQMVSPCIDLTDAQWPVFDFWYHMYGVDMGELHVDVLTQDGYDLDVMPPLIGNKANTWREASFRLYDYIGQVISLRFRGITGADFRSDMALDDFNLWDAVNTGQDENPIAESTITLFPNPTQNSTTLRLEMGDENGQVEILDALSRPVDRFVLTPGWNTVEIPSENYPAGVYYVIAKGASGNVLTVRKLVRQ